MPRKDILITAAFLALFPCPDFPGVRDASNSGSPQMAMKAGLPPVGVVDAPARTARELILADDRKQDQPAERSHSVNPPSPPADTSDPGSNRDLDRPQRASPEAANDLFQLLKQAGPKQGSKSK
jgi:hypothetical protein